MQIGRIWSAFHICVLMEEIMKIIEFDDRYTDEIIDIWNNSLVFDQITRQQFIRYHVNDFNFDKRYFLLAVDEKVVGFIFGIKRSTPYFSRGCESSIAWIKVLGVSKTNQQIGTSLLIELENRFKDAGVKKIVLGNYSPSYLVSGIPQEEYYPAIAFFEHHDYSQVGTSYWMERQLDEYVYPDEIDTKRKDIEKNGYIIQKFDPDKTYQLIKMMKRNFSDSWTSYVVNAIANGTATQTIILCSDPIGKVIGYVSRASIDCDPYRFGPFGIDKDYRNQGIGEIMIHEMFKSMVEKSLNYVYFKNTDDIGCRFYKRQGMSVKRTIIKYEKILDFENK